MLPITSSGRAGLRALLLPLFGIALSACPNQELAALEPCTVSGVNLNAAQDGVDEVDLLFMVDNSSSMAAEQVKLASKLAQLVAVFTSGDREAGKANPREYNDRRFTPVRSLHLGVVSSDLGKPPGVPGDIGTCNANNGAPVGNGVLQHSTDKAAHGIDGKNDANRTVQLVPPDPACAVSVPSYIDFGQTGVYSDANKAAAHFQCISKIGVDGCGIEQQIASAYKALAPASDKIFFGPDTGGQGDRANQGFLRPNSVLAVVIVSDEDDCSITDTAEGADLFRSGDDLSVRCQVKYKENPAYPGIRAVSDLAARFKALRGSYPERLVVAGIVGLPISASGVDYEDFDALLKHPDMDTHVDTNKHEVASVCLEEEDSNVQRPDGVSRGDAKPGRRFVELAREIKALGGSSVLRSICDRDYTAALDQLIEKVAKQLKGACLPRKLALDATGRVACEVVEILPRDTPDNCNVPGRMLAGKRWLAGESVDAPPHVGCTLTQLTFSAGGTPPADAGWYYDQSSADTQALCPGGQRVVVTPTVPLRRGAAARVECFQSQPRVVAQALGRAAINTPCLAGPGCTTDAQTPVDISLPGEPMICEPISKSCQIPCAVSAECPQGWLCDGTGVRFCQNPTCTVAL